MMVRNSVVYFLVPLFFTVSMTGCITSSPTIDVKRNPDSSYRIEVTRCSIDGSGEQAIREDLSKTAEKRCGRHYRWREDPVFNRTWLGTAVLGECPATNAVATAICGESK